MIKKIIWQQVVSLFSKFWENCVWRRFFNRVRNSVQNLTLKVIFSNDELIVIWNRSNLEFCEHSSFLIIDKIVFKSNLKFQNIKITKMSKFSN